MGTGRCKFDAIKLSTRAAQCQFFHGGGKEPVLFQGNHENSWELFVLVQNSRTHATSESFANLSDSSVDLLTFQWHRNYHIYENK